MIGPIEKIIDNKPSKAWRSRCTSIWLQPWIGSQNTEDRQKDFHNSTQSNGHRHKMNVGPVPRFTQELHHTPISNTCFPCSSRSPCYSPCCTVLPVPPSLCSSIPSPPCLHCFLPCSPLQVERPLLDCQGSQ